jgi:Tfp pilus assembly protein PilO
MSTLRAGRVWAASGALGAIALLAIGWFLFIGPQNSRTNDLNNQAAEAQGRLPALQSKLVELRRQNEDLPSYRQQMLLARAALPTTAGLTDFLRQVQAAGDDAGVSVSGVAISSPTKANAAGAAVQAYPINLTVEGGFENVRAFINQIQRVQPRAVLISTTSLTADPTTRSLVGKVSLTLAVQVFVVAA